MQWSNESLRAWIRHGLEKEGRAYSERVLMSRVGGDQVTEGRGGGEVLVR